MSVNTTQELVPGITRVKLLIDVPGYIFYNHAIGVERITGKKNEFGRIYKKADQPAPRTSHGDSRPEWQYSVMVERGTWSEVVEAPNGHPRAVSLIKASRIPHDHISAVSAQSGENIFLHNVGITVFVTQPFRAPAQAGNGRMVNLAVGDVIMLISGAETYSGQKKHTKSGPKGLYYFQPMVTITHPKIWKSNLHYAPSAGVYEVLPNPS